MLDERCIFAGNSSQIKFARSSWRELWSGNGRAKIKISFVLKASAVSGVGASIDQSMPLCRRNQNKIASLPFFRSIDLLLQGPSSSQPLLPCHHYVELCNRTSSTFQRKDKMPLIAAYRRQGRVAAAAAVHRRYEFVLSSLAKQPPIEHLPKTRRWI